MIIYLLTAGKYEDYSVYGAYSSYEKAVERIPPGYKEKSRGVFSSVNKYFPYYIEEWNLDE